MPTNEMIKASVIINTFNRATYLPNAIDSLLQQTYPNLELVVVNGPSTDGTEQVLDRFIERGVAIRRAVCAQRNLSESRNIGIAHAGGDVVLFLDDDAVAHRDWVMRLVNCYQDEAVGAAGGFTFDHTGMQYQCRYTVCDRLGNARYFNSLDPANILNDASDFYFPSLLGTNCSFRRKDLEHIGGFDPAFEYLLDETDVCLRLFERGRRIVTVANAFVFHKYAPSATRTVERIPSSLMAPARSKAYFCVKHGAKRGDQTISLDTSAELNRYKKDIQFSNLWFLDHRRISPAHYAKLTQELDAGLAEGISLGIAELARCRKGESSVPPVGPPPTFVAANAPHGSIEAGARRLAVYLVTQGYPPSDTAGIARWMRECANSLAMRGHDVHVIARATSLVSSVDYESGVWVHRVVDLTDDELGLIPPVPIPRSTARRAEAVYNEIKRSGKIWGADVVIAPIWDVEGILCNAYLDVPVITSLHTTYKLALPYKPLWAQDKNFLESHVEKIIRGEFWLLEHSRRILANSAEIIAAVGDAYGPVLESRLDTVSIIHHGLGSKIAPSEAHGNVPPTLRQRRNERLRILYVGRLEPRKGPDQLLAALNLIPKALLNVEITFVGQRDESDIAYIQRIDKLSAQLRRKAPSAVLRFTGYLNDDELEGYYAASDIFVVPSRFESFGLILLEGMRHGLAIIASDVGGAGEVLRDESAGMIFHRDDVPSLADKLRRLIEDAALRTRLGKGAKAIYEQQYTAAVMAEQLESLLLAASAEAGEQ